MDRMPWNPAITVPTFICSLFSSVATAIVLFMWMLSNDPAKRRSSRYALVINLTLAEFINSTNNTISGGWVLSHKILLPAGPSCNFNGWLGQVSVQAADFSVLAIAVLTFMTLTFNRWVSNTSLPQTILVCTSVWLVPITTGTIALALGKYQPVSGNWCWIAPEPLWLRYVLGHGWRMSIFVVIIFLYSIIFVIIRRRLTARVNSNQHRYSVTYGSQVELTQGQEQLIHAHDDILKGQKPIVGAGHGGTSSNEGIAASSRSIDLDYKGKEDPIKRPELARSAFSYDDDIERQRRQRRLALKPKLRIIQSSQLDQETWHWFLLSAFPLSYIVVWIPGLANRFVELSGNSSSWLSALQAMTQLTGLVNAVVYGLREHRGLWRNLGERYYNQY